jgi:tRNA/rRNA methyltransferase
MLPPDPTRFVLMRPSHPGNVGAAARALRVMGFGQLVIVGSGVGVDGRALCQHPEALARASGATEVLEAAQVAQSFDEALGGAQVVCATAMTPRDFGPPTAAPREALPALAQRGVRMAFVFGEERFGLSNDDLYRCHQVLSIPTDPGYGSLNLAQAVQLIAYEWRQALGGFAVLPRTAAEPLADAQAVLGVVEHWRQVLQETGYWDPQSPKKLVPRLTRLAHRLQLTEAEVHILRGMARSVLAPRPRRAPEDPTAAADGEAELHGKPGKP